MNPAKFITKFYPKDIFIAISEDNNKSNLMLLCYKVLSSKYKTLFLEKPLDLLKLNPTVKRVLYQTANYLNHITPKILISTGQNEFVDLLDDGYIILNWNNLNNQKIPDNLKNKVVFYGTDKESCDVWIDNIKLENYKNSFELNFRVERVKINYNHLGRYQIFPALAAATLGILQGLSLTQIKRVLESIAPTEHNMQICSGPNDSVIVDDSFCSSLEEVQSSIDILLEMPGRRRIIVLGEINCEGVAKEKIYQQIAQRIYKEKIDFCLLGPGETSKAEEELRALGFWDEKLETNLQIPQIVSKLLNMLKKGDICLIVSSRSTKFDEIVGRVIQNK